MAGWRFGRVQAEHTCYLRRLPLFASWTLREAHCHVLSSSTEDMQREAIVGVTSNKVWPSCSRTASLLSLGPNHWERKSAPALLLHLTFVV